MLENSSPHVGSLVHLMWEFLSLICRGDDCYYNNAQCCTLALALIDTAWSSLDSPCNSL